MQPRTLAVKRDAGEATPAKQIIWLSIKIDHLSEMAGGFLMLDVEHVGLRLVSRDVIW